MAKSAILDKNNLPEKRDISVYIKDISKQQFGELMALYPSTQSASDGSIYWVCKCNCGNYVLHTSCDLKRKGNHHCTSTVHNIKDMNKYRDRLYNELNGKINNNLQVIEVDHCKNKKIYLKCKCLKCGTICVVRKDSFLNGKTTSCGCIRSKGEETIERILNVKNISYKTEYIFKDLKDKSYLRFDFAIFHDNKIRCLIEFQGSQHLFSDHNGWNNNLHLANTQLHDKQKFKYCQIHNIPIYYITYNDNIQQKMEEILNELYSE